MIAVRSPALGIAWARSPLENRLGTGGLQSSVALLEKLTAVRQGGRPLVLGLDYDGTLVPRVAHRRLACLPGRNRELLQKLAAVPGVLVVVVSERALDELQGMVGVDGLFYGGTSGLEMDFRGNKRNHPFAAESDHLVADVAQQLQEVARNYSGARVERNTLRIVLNYQAVQRVHVRTLCAKVRGFFRPWSDYWRILDRPCAIEATLALRWTKASVLQMILAEAGNNAFPFYAGDEPSDEGAMKCARTRGGIAASVGERISAVADVHFSAPERLEEFLNQLLGQFSENKE